MTPNEIEQIQARRVMYAAQAYAQGTARPCDVQASTVAILVLALELATPDLSDDARSSFFNKGECDV